MNDTGMSKSVGALAVDGTVSEDVIGKDVAAGGVLTGGSVTTRAMAVAGPALGALGADSADDAAVVSVAAAAVESAEPTGLTGLTPALGYGMNRRETSDIIEQVGQPAAVSADIVLPVHNAQAELESHVGQLVDFLDSNALLRNDFTWNIVLADDGSTDSTWQLCSQLATSQPGRIRALRLQGHGQSGSGRGHALKLAWGQSHAQVLAYMDISLSTDVKDVGFLIGSLLVGGADVAIGSRLLGESQVSRSVHRDFISRTYNLMLRSYLGATFHDAQCEFKALTARAAQTLLPLICDDGLFFDAELLLLAQDAGMLIYEIPVVWKEHKEARFSITDTVQQDLDGMRRMKRTFARGVNAEGRRLPWAKTSAAAVRQADVPRTASAVVPHAALIDIASVSVNSQGSQAQHGLVK